MANGKEASLVLHRNSEGAWHVGDLKQTVDKMCTDCQYYTPDQHFLEFYQALVKSATYRPTGSSPSAQIEALTDYLTSMTEAMEETLELLSQITLEKNGQIDDVQKATLKTKFAGLLGFLAQSGAALGISVSDLVEANGDQLMLLAGKECKNHAK